MKWTENRSNDEPTSVVARRTIEAHLLAARRKLALSVEVDDPAHVHQLRVSTRRAMAALELYEAFLPKGRSRRMRKRLRRLRRAAGYARDLDVLAERLLHAEHKSPHIEAALRAERAQARQVLVAFHSDSALELESSAAEVVERVRARGRVELDPPFGLWARAELREEVARYFDSIPAESSDVEALHGFRIRSKRLRYTIELLASAFSERLQSEVYPRFKQLQDELGAINDHVTAIAHLERWRVDAESPEAETQVAEEVAEEQHRLGAAQARFDAWWTPEEQSALRRLFDHVFAETREAKDAELCAYNRRAWDLEVAKGNRWTVPVDEHAVARARSGELSLVLTPTKIVPRAWYPASLSGLEVLCLASGGGQQGPLLAAAGARVTVFDNSTAQLDQDRKVAEREGLELRTVQGTMLDLSVFEGNQFDLIFHPVSNCFVPNVRPVWREAHRILRVGGLLLAGTTNPVFFAIDPDTPASGVVQFRFSIPYSDLSSLTAEERRRYTEEGEPLVFGHTLEDQIGGQIDAGFVISGFYEDVSGESPLDAYLPTFIATRSVKV